MKKINVTSTLWKNMLFSKILQPCLIREVTVEALPFITAQAQRTHALVEHQHRPIAQGDFYKYAEIYSPQYRKARWEFSKGDT